MRSTPQQRYRSVGELVVALRQAMNARVLETEKIQIMAEMSHQDNRPEPAMQFKMLTPVPPHPSVKKEETLYKRVTDFFLPAYKGSTLASEIVSLSTVLIPALKPGTWTFTDGSAPAPFDPFSWWLTASDTQTMEASLAKQAHGPVVPSGQDKVSRNSRRSVIATLTTTGVVIGSVGLCGMMIFSQIPASTQNSNSAAGGVIGTTKLAVNAALNFPNPADGKSGVLVHLSGGSFSAFDRTCTHSGVYVSYDAASQKLICPAHSAIFDPASSGKVVSGPANKPLRTLPIRVRSDGKIILAT